jgi:DNA-3-methyladenine glycosylase
LKVPQLKVPERAAFPRELLATSALASAPALLGALLVSRRRVGRIVEVEAYNEGDPASHSYRGRTARNGSMFGPPGHLYVYRIYGLHWCANVVCGPEGVGEALLVRAVSIVAGETDMRLARPAAKKREDLTNGPAKLCEAFDIDGDSDGVDLCGVDMCGRRSELRLMTDGNQNVVSPVVTAARIGISKAVDLPWRFLLSGDPFLSRPDRVRIAPK